MVNYLALYSVLKGLFRWGVNVTPAAAALRPLCTSLINWREAGESALTVMIFFPVSYVKVSPFTFCTRRFSSLIRLIFSAGTALCGAAALLGLSPAEDTLAKANIMQIKKNRFMGVF